MDWSCRICSLFFNHRGLWGDRNVTHIFLNVKPIRLACLISSRRKRTSWGWQVSGKFWKKCWWSWYYQWERVWGKRWSFSPLIWYPTLVAFWLASSASSPPLHLALRLETHIYLTHLSHGLSVSLSLSSSFICSFFFLVHLYSLFSFPEKHEHAASFGLDPAGLCVSPLILLQQPHGHK